MRLRDRLRRVHRDYVRLDPLKMTSTLVRRIHPADDDPSISRQAYDHWATYFDVSEPHSMADCPYRGQR